MKTPENVELGVQSIGKVDAGLPSAVANAEAGALNAFGKTAEAFGQVGLDIYKRDAVAERNSLASEYYLREAEMRAELQRNPYETMPDGSLRSRHVELAEQYEERETALREEVMGKAQNGIAVRQLGQDFELAHTKSRKGIDATSMKWANDASFANNEKAFISSLQNFQWDEAERVATEQVQVGQISDAQFVERLFQIENHKTYNTIEQGISNAGPVSPGISSTRSETIDSKLNLSDAQKKTLHKKNFDNVVESVTEGLTNVLENGFPGLTVDGVPNPLGGMGVTLDARYTEGVGEDLGGLTAGRLAIQIVRHKNPEDLGLRDEAELSALVNKMNSLHQQYEVRIKQEQGDITASQNCDKFTVPGAQPSPVSYSNKGLPSEGAAHGQDGKAINCAFFKRTAGLDKWSQAWVREAVDFETKNFGYFSNAMMGEFSRTLVNPGASEQAAQEAVMAVDVLMTAKQSRWNILQKLKPDDRALVETIHAMTQAGGTVTAEAMKTVTESFGKVNKETREGRLSAYAALADPRAALESAFEGMSSADDPWFADLEISEDMITDFNTLMQTQVQLYENPDHAARAAVDLLRNSWVSTDIGVRNSWLPNDKRMIKNSPLSLKDPLIPMEKKQEAFSKDWTELMTNNDLDQTTHSIGMYSPHVNNGKGAWMVNDDNGNPITIGGEVLLWSPDYADTTHGRLEAFDAETARINADYDMAIEQSNTEEKLAAYPGHRTQLREAGDAIGETVDAAFEKPRKYLTEVFYPYWLDPDSKEEIAALAAKEKASIAYDQAFKQRAREYDYKLRREQELADDPARYRYSRRSASQFNRLENRERSAQRKILEQAGYTR